MESLKLIEDQVIRGVEKEEFDKDDIFAEVDRLLDGTDDDKLKAHEILQTHKAKVHAICLTCKGVVNPLIALRIKISVDNILRYFFSRISP